MKLIFTLLSKILHNSYSFYGFWCIVIVFFGQLPILLRVFHAPPGTYYPYLDTIAPSDYYYPSIIRFGMGPDWLTKIPYTVQEHQGSLIQILFMLLGKIALVLKVGSHEMFALSRVGAGLVFIITIVFFVKNIVPSVHKRLLFLIIIFSQPYPFLIDVSKEFFGKWTWHFGGALRRISVMPPHYTLGKALVLLGITLYFLAIKSKRKKLLFGSGIAMVFAGIVYPPPVFIVMVSLTVSYLFILFEKLIHRKYINKTIVVFFLIFLGSCIVPLGILKIELLKGFPWDLWNKVELGWNNPKMNFEYEYLHMMGTYLLFLPVSLIHFVQKKEKTLFDIFVWIWCVSAFLLFPFADTLQVGKFRFTEGIQFVPLGILTYGGVLQIGEWMGIMLGSLARKFTIGIICLMITVNFVFFSFYNTYDDTKNLWENWSNVYFVSTEIEAAKFLDKVAQNNEIVLADRFTSNYLPSYARVRTIIGFSDLFEKFRDFQLEEGAIQSILSQTTSEVEAKTYLQKNKVSFVYIQKTYYPHTNLLYPTLMDRIYENQYFEIYKVK